VHGNIIEERGNLPADRGNIIGERGNFQYARVWKTGVRGNNIEEHGNIFGVQDNIFDVRAAIPDVSEVSPFRCVTGLGHLLWAACGHLAASAFDPKPTAANGSFQGVT